MKKRMKRMAAKRLRMGLQKTSAKLCGVEVIPTVCVESLASLKAAGLTCTLQQILVGVKEGEMNV